MNNKYLFKNLNYFGNVYVKSKFNLYKFIENDIYMIEWMKVHLRYILVLLGNISKYIQYILDEENQIELDDNKIISIFNVLADSPVFRERKVFKYKIEIPSEFAKKISDITDNFRDLFRMNENFFLTKFLSFN